MDGGQAATALRLVNTVAVAESGTRTSRWMIVRRGVTTGKNPSAVRRAAVWAAPGWGRVIKIRFKKPLLPKSLRSMMC